MAVKQLFAYGLIMGISLIACCGVDVESVDLYAEVARVRKIAKTTIKWYSFIAKA